MFTHFVTLGIIAGLLPAFAAAHTFTPCDSAPGNLVHNCGFETGDFSGWTQTGNAEGTYVVSNFDGFVPNSGLQFAALGPSGSNGLLSQTLLTNPGDTYSISWYLASDGGTPNTFSAIWNGITIFSGTNITSPDFLFFSFTQLATTVSSPLTFSFSDEPSYLALDDVAVVDIPRLSNSAPEPSSVILLVTGTAALLSRALWVKRKRRSGQIQ